MTTQEPEEPESEKSKRYWEDLRWCGLAPGGNPYQEQYYHVVGIRTKETGRCKTFVTFAENREAAYKRALSEYRSPYFEWEIDP